MTLNHVHLRVSDLSAAILWFDKVMTVRPGFQSDHMATFEFGAFTLIFDAANDDVSATIGFESQDCDSDFRTVVERGAVALDPPANKDWGVRTAYFKGPGALKFEIEGPLKK